METAQSEEQTIENLKRRVMDLGCELYSDSHVFDGEAYLYLHIPYTELIGRTQPFVHALFYLAALPEYIGPLRAEVEEVIEREAWTKEALSGSDVQGRQFHQGVAAKDSAGKS